mmetsp:Transcript_14051/g.35353  ORF Transcript_14051/g.35353 Transcript_14051/m.35353 type:complete len:234 (-) Transcript_14051:891-1592(-)
MLLLTTSATSLRCDSSNTAASGESLGSAYASSPITCWIVVRSSSSIPSPSCGDTSPPSMPPSDLLLLPFLSLGALFPSLWPFPLASIPSWLLLLCEADEVPGRDPAEGCCCCEELLAEAADVEAVDAEGAVGGRWSRGAMCCWAARRATSRLPSLRCSINSWHLRCARTFGLEDMRVGKLSSILAQASGSLPWTRSSRISLRMEMEAWVAWGGGAALEPSSSFGNASSALWHA